MEIGQLQSSISIKGTVFRISMVNNPSDCIIVWEDDRSRNNHVDAKIPNSLINELVILKVWKVIVVKYRIVSGPIQLVGLTNFTTGIREDTEILVFGKYVFLEVFCTE